MNATALLVRHAAHAELGSLLSGRRRDVALSREGLEQAAIVADLLSTAPLAAIYSSPRERAWYTARDIAEPHDLKVAIADGLDEVDFGAWSGRSFAELDGDPDWQTGNEARGSARAPGGETMREAVAPAAASLAAMARGDEGGPLRAGRHL